ncbi:YdbL family protein [Shewanella gelidii]|nr:YdbL family protein [Shewanella gelidii]MCL1099465.1 YdbL family protein [Shewanella gelidii]
MKTKLLVGALGLLLSVSAFAMSLQDAKSSGFLGEKNSGYLGVVKANSEAKTLMQKVNAKRRAHYQKIALKNKISTEDVASMAGKKAIKATAPGNYVEGQNGKWVKK